MIIVDDGSPDGTQDVVKKLQELYREDHILLRARPKKLRLAKVPAKFYHEADGYWCKYSYWNPVCQRWCGVHGWNLKRKLTSRGANVLAQTLFWPGVSDLTGSLRLYKKSVLEDVISTCVSKG